VKKDSKKKQIEWSRGPTKWIENQILHISIPFTWNLPEVRAEVQQKSFLWKQVKVGGPAVSLLPDFFADLSWVKAGGNYPGALQKINPLATNTTVGCIRKCRFCAVQKIEPKFYELQNWPDLPIICDNNLLAASMSHFHKVIDRLARHGWADFNQGLDSRLLTKEHAKKLAQIKKPKIRLALDNQAYKDEWLRAYEKLIEAGIKKTSINSYALIGFTTGVEEAWARCEFIAKHCYPLPMWFHRLDQLQKNIVTKRQRELGWTDYERKKIMGFFYKRGRTGYEKYFSERVLDPKKDLFW